MRISFFHVSFILGSLLSSSMSLAAQQDGMYAVYTDMNKHASTWAIEKKKPALAKERSNLTRSSLLPQFSGLFRRTKNLEAEGQALVQAYQSTWQVTASQKILDFSSLNNYQASRLLLKQAKHSEQYNKQVRVLQAAQSYFNLLYALEAYELTSSQLQALSQQYVEAQAKLKAGLVTNANEQLAKAQLETMKAQMSQRRYAIAVAKHALDKDTGHETSSLKAFSIDYFPSWPKSLPKPLSLSQAAKKHQALLSARANVKARRLQKTAAQLSLLPTVSLQGHWGKTYNIFNANGASSPINRYVTLDVQMPILTGGAQIADIKEAGIQHSVAREEYTSLIKSLFEDMNNTYIEWHHLRGALSADKQAIQSYKSTLNSQLEAYHAGVGALRHVLDSLADVHESQLKFIEDRYHFIMTYLRYQLTRGELTPSTLKRIDRVMDHKLAVPSLSMLK